MTDKEQIIINGVQFNKFGDFNIDYDFDGKFQSISSSAKEYKILKSLIEQLAHKTQEYNDLLEQHKELDDRANKMIEEKYNLARECEELKENENFLKKYFDEQKGKYERIVERRNKKINLYRKALEEIEEFCITYSDNHDAYETVYKYILDIINEAKEEE